MESITKESGSAIEERLKHVQDWDVVIAHMNKPASESAEGLSAALDDLQRAGYTFVRLDQVNLEVVSDTPKSKDHPMKEHR